MNDAAVSIEDEHSFRAIQHSRGMVSFSRGYIDILAIRYAPRNYVDKRRTEDEEALSFHGKMRCSYCSGLYCSGLLVWISRMHSQHRQGFAISLSAMLYCYIWAIIRSQEQQTVYCCYCRLVTFDFLSREGGRSKNRFYDQDQPQQLFIF